MSSLEREATEIEKIRAEIILMGAQVEKMRNETRKIVVEFTLYPFVAGATCLGAFLAFAKYIG